MVVQKFQQYDGKTKILFIFHLNIFILCACVYFSFRCKQKLYSTECENTDCIVLQYGSSGQTNPKSFENFEINVNISDHTDTIKNCRLIGTVAERMIGHTIVTFNMLTDIDRTAIKWQYLLERCTIKLLIKRKSIIRSQTFVQIVDCCVADSAEVFNKIKVY